MEDLAVYGYVTPTKLRIVIALALSDMVVRDADVVTVRPYSLGCTCCPHFFLTYFPHMNRYSKPCIRHTAAPLRTPS